MGSEKKHGGKRANAGRKPANGETKKDFFTKSVVFHSLEDMEKTERMAKEANLTFSQFVIKKIFQ